MLELSLSVRASMSGTPPTKSSTTPFRGQKYRELAVKSRASVVKGTGDKGPAAVLWRNGFTVLPP
jgi:hypothetical protein